MQESRGGGLSMQESRGGGLKYTRIKRWWSEIQTQAAIKAETQRLSHSITQVVAARTIQRTNQSVRQAERFQQRDKQTASEG